MAFQIKYSLICSPGKVRTSNQDNLIFDGRYLDAVHDGTGGVVSGIITDGGKHIFGVFDGMGGHEKGEMASYIAAKAFSEYPMNESDVTIDMFNCCINANLMICRYAAENRISRTGTTAVLAAIDKGFIHICNIGDSKLFICRNNEIKQLSVDHVTFAPYGRKAPLSQNLGIPETVMLIEPYTSHIKANTLDRLVICSDGLTDMVPQAQICEIVSSQKPDEAVNSLYSLAMNNGGRDNITIIILEVIDPDAAPGIAKAYKAADPYEDTQGEITHQDSGSARPKKRKGSAMLPVLCVIMLACVLIAASVPMIMKKMGISKTERDRHSITTSDGAVTLPTSESEANTSDFTTVADSETAESITDENADMTVADTEVTDSDDVSNKDEVTTVPEPADDSSEADRTDEDEVDVNEQKPAEDDSENKSLDEMAEIIANEIVQKIGEDFLCETKGCKNQDGPTVYHKAEDVVGDKEAKKCYKYTVDNNYCEKCGNYFYSSNGKIKNDKDPAKVREKTACAYSDPNKVYEEEVTCTEDGVKIKMCTRCDHISTTEDNKEVTKALGHDNDNGIPYEQGDYYFCKFTCKRCSETTVEDKYKDEREAFLKETFDSKKELTADDFYKYLNDERTNEYFTKQFLEKKYDSLYEKFYTQSYKEDTNENGENILRLNVPENKDEKDALIDQVKLLNDCHKILYNEDDQVLSDTYKKLTAPKETKKAEDSKK